MKIVPIKQKDDTACGPTCIKMVADYFDVPIKLGEIEKISQYIRKDGLTNKDLIDTLEYFGFVTKDKLNVTWGELCRANTKDKVIIISWMKKGYLGHFSIVDTITKEHIILIDPDEGKPRKMEKVIFMRLWMGYDDIRGWYPVKNTDIQLRWMCIVTKKRTKKTRGE